MKCFRRGVINLLHVLSFDSTPVIRLKNIQRERVGFAGGHADAVGVVFDEKEQWKFLFFGKTNRFKKISLTRGRIAYRCHDKVLFPV